MWTQVWVPGALFTKGRTTDIAPTPVVRWSYGLSTTSWAIHETRRMYEVRTGVVHRV